MALPDPVLQLLIAFIGGGVAGGLVTFFVERKMKTYELKLQKYLELGAVLGSIPVTRKLDDHTMQTLNGALVFGSDEVASEVLKLILLIADRQKAIAKDGKQDISAEEFKPLLLAIRNDLNLRSSKLQKMPLWFFSKEAKVE